MDTNAFDEGIDAYCKGICRNACPYKPGTREREDWLSGWDEAEQLDFEAFAEGFRP